MELEEARANIGGLVTYDPGGMQRPEWGLIYRVGTAGGTVFVRYAGDPQPKATPVERLTLEAPPVVPIPRPDPDARIAAADAYVDRYVRGDAENARNWIPGMRAILRGEL